MKIIRLITTLTLILGIVYFALDRHLYFYGKNDFNFYNRLPLKIKPEYRHEFERGFLLRDEFGFSLVSKGVVQYWHSDIKLTITDIIKYGFNENELVAYIQEIS